MPFLDIYIYKFFNILFYIVKNILNSIKSLILILKLIGNVYVHYLHLFKKTLIAPILLSFLIIF